MMGYIVSAFLFLMGIVTYKKQKTLASPDVLYCFEWGLITLLASLQLFTLYAASEKTWFIILFGSIFYLLGTSFGSKIKLSQGYSDTEDMKNYENQLMSKKTFWILLIGLSVYYLLQFRQTIEFMSAGFTLGQIRDAGVGNTQIEGYVRNTGALAEYFNLACAVVELFTVASGITYFFLDTKRHGKMLLGVLALEILASVTNGGRYALAYLVIEVFIGYSIFKKTGNRIDVFLSKRIKRMVKRILTLLFSVIVFVTLIRGVQTNELITKFYRYICGNVVFLDLHIQDLDATGFWSCSFAGCYGFWAVILPILNRMGISYPDIYIQTISTVMDGQVFRKIGESLYTNAFITPFYHLYADFRWFGVIFGMFLFGAVAGYFYRKATYTMDALSIVNYLIIGQMVFKSLHTFPLASKVYAMGIFVIFYLNARERKRLSKMR